MTSKSLFGKIRLQIIAFIEHMLFLLSERSLLKRINEKRWNVPDRAINPMLGLRSTYEDHTRWSSGIKRDEMEQNILAEDNIQTGIKGFLLLCHQKIRPKYFRTFTYKFDDLFDKCVEKQLLKQKGDRYILTSKGEDLVKWYWWMKTKYVDIAITKLLEWGIPAFAVWLLLRFFDIQSK